MQFVLYIIILQGTTTNPCHYYHFYSVGVATKTCKYISVTPQTGSYPYRFHFLCGKKKKSQCASFLMKVIL